MQVLHLFDEPGDIEWYSVIEGIPSLLIRRVDVISLVVLHKGLISEADILSYPQISIREAVGSNLMKRE